MEMDQLLEWFVAIIPFSPCYCLESVGFLLKLKGLILRVCFSGCAKIEWLFLVFIRR